MKKIEIVPEHVLLKQWWKNSPLRHTTGILQCGHSSYIVCARSTYPEALRERSAQWTRTVYGW